ncbi:hypothetical protein POPTR_001G219250v4 [Populus trichocarpa]|uniref:Uncharacterized protein n=1 Tax=Populus trichocarpa TaxID=3694 RepID=A0ACC0TKU3_POPTR|nr:hypothetical protein POPTR_001G219250v4 [Populus trichocarpa]
MSCGHHFSLWPNNHGIWVDEFESSGLVDCLDKTWPMTYLYIDDHKTKYLDHPADRSSFDVIVSGTGPVGPYLAEQVSRYGVKIVWTKHGL